MIENKWKLVLVFRKLSYKGNANIERAPLSDNLCVLSSSIKLHNKSTDQPTLFGVITIIKFLSLTTFRWKRFCRRDKIHVTFKFKSKQYCSRLNVNSWRILWWGEMGESWKDFHGEGDSLALTLTPIHEASAYALLGIFFPLNELLCEVKINVKIRKTIRRRLTRKMSEAL